MNTLGPTRGSFGVFLPSTSINLLAIISLNSVCEFVQVDVINLPLYISIRINE